MPKDDKQISISPERRLEKKGLSVGILAAGIMHIGAIILLGWLAGKEPDSLPDFPYVPLASLDFSSYDPDGGAPAGLALPQQNSQEQAVPPPASGHSLPIASHKANQNSAQLSDNQAERAPQEKLQVLESKAESAEEIAPLPPKKAPPKQVPREKATSPARNQSPAKVVAQSPPDKNPESHIPSVRKTPDQRTLGQSASSEGISQQNTSNQGISGQTGSNQNSPDKIGSGKGGSGMGSGRGNPDAEKAYLAHIVKKLNRHKKYPAAARTKRFSGTVTINFTLNANGNVVTSRMVKGSGHPALDREAMALVQRASPFKAIPQTINRKSMTLTVPIHFTTR